MQIMIIGGTDGPGWILTPHGLKPVPGWNPEALKELVTAVRVLRNASQLKTPGVLEATTKALLPLVEKEIGANLKEGGAIIIHE